MKAAYSLIALACLTILQCQGGGEAERINLTQNPEVLPHTENSSKIVESSHQTNCEKCDSIILNFPDNEASFNDQYGYNDRSGGNIRYSFYEEDIDSYFTCVQSCHTSQPMLDVAVLATVIEYEPDASSLYHFNLLKYMNLYPNFLVLFKQEYGAGKVDTLIKFVFSPLNSNDEDFAAFCKQVNKLYIGSNSERSYHQFCR